MKRFWQILTILAAICIAQLAAAQTRPAILDRVGVEQHLGESIPFDVIFRDETGNQKPLSNFFHGRPVLLCLVYYQCPMLCSVTLNQLTRSLNALQESAGEKFDVITISFDPRETAELAAAKKRSYLNAYRRPSAASGWHFLTGSQQSIDHVTRTAGFNYRWDPESKTFSHASAVLVLTPRGKISRYLLGVDYPPTQLREAMLDAGNDVVGAPAEQIFLYCFRYDPATGRYGIVIMRMIRLLATATLVALVSLIGGFVLRERRATS